MHTYLFIVFCVGGSKTKLVLYLSIMSSVLYMKYSIMVKKYSSYFSYGLLQLRKQPPWLPISLLSLNGFTKVIATPKYENYILLRTSTNLFKCIA